MQMCKFQARSAFEKNAGTSNCVTAEKKADEPTVAVPHPLHGKKMNTGLLTRKQTHTHGLPKTHKGTHTHIRAATLPRLFLKTF